MTAPFLLRGKLIRFPAGAAERFIRGREIRLEPAALERRRL
jgi:hypothetical protein